MDATTEKATLEKQAKLATEVVLVLVIGVILFGFIKIIDATQTDTTPCLEWTREDCVKEAQQPPCPQSERKSSGMLDAAAQLEQPFKLECSPRGERPICPNLNPIPRCPRDASREQGQLNKENTYE